MLANARHLLDFLTQDREDGVQDLLARLNLERGTTFVFATHDPAIEARALRRVRLQDGVVAEVRA